jgi:hypothetical protein
MHKNRIILILGIFLILIPESGFEPGFKKLATQVIGFIIIVLAFLIERHINISLHWRRKNTVTPTATTYVEHNGAAQNNINPSIS